MGLVFVLATDADGTAGFKDRAMRYGLLSSFLLLLLSDSLDDCDSADT